MRTPKKKAPQLRFHESLLLFQQHQIQCTAPNVDDLPPDAILHMRKEALETIAQIPHAWVRVLLQFEALRNDLYRPAHQLGMLPCLEAEIEVTWMLVVDAELIDGTLRVGLSVRGQPSFWGRR